MRELIMQIRSNTKTIVSNENLVALPPPPGSSRSKAAKKEADDEFGDFQGSGWQKF